MREVNVLSIQRSSAADRARIEAVDPGVRLIDAGGWFDGEIRETWSDFAAARYLAPNSTGAGSREERDRLLGQAEGDHRRLAVSARHAGPGAAASLVSPAPGRRQQPVRQRSVGQRRDGDDLARASNPLPIAEYAVAGILHFAMGLNQAAIDRASGMFEHRSYRPLLVEGKTACVVGAGGIGLEVGRLCAALGMRVIGTRRQVPPGAPLPAGFSELGGAEAIDRFLPRSDFVAVCCQWTPETTRLFQPRPLRPDEAGQRPGQRRAR